MTSPKPKLLKLFLFLTIVGIGASLLNMHGIGETIGYLMVYLGAMYWGYQWGKDTRKT